MCTKLQDRLRMKRLAGADYQTIALMEEAARKIDELEQHLFSLEQQAVAQGVTLTQRSGSSSDWDNDT